MLRTFVRCMTSDGFVRQSKRALSNILNISYSLRYQKIRNNKQETQSLDSVSTKRLFLKSNI